MQDRNKDEGDALPTCPLTPGELKLALRIANNLPADFDPDLDATSEADELAIALPHPTSTTRTIVVVLKTRQPVLQYRAGALAAAQQLDIFGIEASDISSHAVLLEVRDALARMARTMPPLTVDDVVRSGAAVFERGAE